MPPDAKDKAIADLTASNLELQNLVKEQEAILKDLAEPPGMLANLTHVLPKNALGQELVVLDERILMSRPKELAKVKLEEGDILHIGKSEGDGKPYIVGKVDLPLREQAVMKVAEITDDGQILLGSGVDNVIPLWKCPLVPKPEVGDRLIVGGPHLFRATALKNLGKAEKTFNLSTELNVTWDDIGGQTQAKAALREAIEYPIIHADLYKALGKKPIKGVLLEGPPGCGKTLLAKAAATAIAKLHGKVASATSYIYVKGPEVLAMYVGVAEERIRNLFKMAQSHRAKHGYPAIVFIDEAEALLSRRGSGVSSDMEKTIVPAFLAELDGINESGAMVILATNRGDRLDPAVIRPGRIDRRITVSRPSKQDCTQIFGIYLGRAPTCTEVDSVSTQSSEHLFSEANTLCNLKTSEGYTLPFTLGHVASGAMIENIVDRASSIVMHTAITAHEAGKRKNMALTNSHVTEAIAEVHASMKRLDHGDDIKLLQETTGIRVTGVTPAHA